MRIDLCRRDTGSNGAFAPGLAVRWCGGLTHAAGIFALALSGRAA
jgi:hypothetical protein